ncbi:hypothetical protein [Kitasatospora sp. MBT63]|uniref:hypothetical protein n=1 Tax=Kitasatospora sp. MBT63 TaxID=1444768 RepID=UPI0009E9CF1F|nr:hypothetical protein [Kitasatospora sp. MBT63]
MSAAHALAPGAPLTRDEEILIGRSYTRARRHPLVVGKLPGAGRIPGGPYTITQLVTMVIGFVVLIMTRALWAHFGLFDIVIMVVLPWGLAWVMRYARVDGRDPARAIRSLFVYLSAPGSGRLAGRPQRRGRIQAATGRCTVRERDAPEPASDPHGTATTAPASTRSAPTAQRVRPAAVPAPNRPRPVTPKARPASAPEDPRPPAGAGRRSPGSRSTLQNLLASLDEA